MPLLSKCTECGKRLKVRERHVGREVRCPACGKMTTIGSAVPFGEKETKPDGPVSRTVNISGDAQESTPGGVAEETPPKRGNVGRFELRNTLGQGGFGTVYLAYDPMLDREVAIKIPKLLSEESDRLQRFFREPKMAARLEHGNIARIYDVGEEDGTPFFVMEYVQGRTLSRIVRRRGPLPIAEAVDYLLQAARGLEYAHERGVIHRDIKPGNLMVNRKGTVKILDMGLARQDKGILPKDHDSLTQSGQVMGSVDYMAPEQAEDPREAGRQSDIYSLGCTLYYLLRGKPVYEGDTFIQKYVAHVQHPIPVLCEADSGVGSALDALFRKMVAKRPESRFHSMAEVIVELEKMKAAARAESGSEAGAMTVTIAAPPIAKHGTRKAAKRPKEPMPPSRPFWQRLDFREFTWTPTAKHIARGAAALLAILVLFIIVILRNSFSDWSGLKRPIAMRPNPVSGMDGGDEAGATTTTPIPGSGASEGGSTSPDSGETGSAPDSTPPRPSPSEPPKPEETKPAETRQPEPGPPKSQPPETQPPKTPPVAVFNTFPKVTLLPAPSERTPIPLGALEGPADAPLSLELLGGAFRVSSESLEFRLVEEEPGKIWAVELDGTPVARIKRDANRILFEWDAGIPDAKAAHAALLQYTILRLKSDDETRELLFTRPVEIQPLSGEFKPDGTLKCDLPELPVGDVDSFRVALTEIVGPTGAVSLEGKVEPLDAQNSQRTIQVPDLEAAEVELMFILTGSRDAVVMRVKYQIPGGRMVSLNQRQWDLLRNRSANSPNPQTAAGAMEVLGLIQAFAQSGKVHFRAYRQIGDKQIDVIVTKDPPKSE